MSFYLLNILIEWSRAYVIRVGGLGRDFWRNVSSVEDSFEGSFVKVSVISNAIASLLISSLSWSLGPCSSIMSIGSILTIRLDILSSNNL